MSFKHTPLRTLSGRDSMRTKVIAEGRAREAARRQRRTRVIAVAAVLALVAGVGVGWWSPWTQRRPIPANPSPTVASPSPTVASPSPTTASPSPSPTTGSAQEVVRLPRIRVAAASGHDPAPLQRFADDIADGNPATPERCWMIHPERRSAYTELGLRKMILADLVAEPIAAEHFVRYGKELVQRDQFDLPYQCTIDGQVYDVPGYEESNDAKWLLTRYAAVLDGKPMGGVDAYVPLCADAADGGYIQAGGLTPEGRRAMISLGQGPMELASGQPSKSVLIRPQGASGPTVTWFFGASCVTSFVP